MAQETIIKELEAAESKRQKRQKRIRILLPVILLLLFAAGWVGNWIVLRLTTQTRMESMIGRAHTFALITQDWMERGNMIESGVFRVNDADSGFGKTLLYYFSDAEGEWFGLALDEDGKIAYTMYSRTEIPEEYLQTPPDYDEQYACLDSFFLSGRKKAIAVWTPEPAAGMEGS